eukprot:482062_1
MSRHSVHLHKFRRLVAFEESWKWQKALRQEHVKHKSSRDVLIMLQHPPVYTTGRRPAQHNLLFDESKSPHPVFKVERGGDVTHHCPGQIVGYPLLDLNRYKRDLHWYMNRLEEVIIRTLHSYDIPAGREKDYTGVWVGDSKLAALGISVSRWKTMHGFALNVRPSLSGFEAIVPCGIRGDELDKRALKVGSMEQWIPNINEEEVQSVLLDKFRDVFNVDFIDCGSTIPEPERSG